MNLRVVTSADIQNKRILYRSPYDIEPIEDNGRLIVKDDSRIVATLPTLEYLLQQNCSIVVLTHIGRPDGEVVEELRTKPIAERLSELLHRPVKTMRDCIGPEVESVVKSLQPGEIVMLENTRFYDGEQEDDDDFAQKLAALGEIVVNDGFPQAHRQQASVTGIMRHRPSYAGLYFADEVKNLSGLLANPAHPFVAIIGGAKVSDKVDAIRNLFHSVDVFLVGGGVANVFFKAEGKEMGNSFIEDVFVDKAKSGKSEHDWVSVAKEIKHMEKDATPFIFTDIGMPVSKVQTPVDLITAEADTENSEVVTVAITESYTAVPSGWAAYDIGPLTQELYTRIITQAGTVFWNGPVGKFEDDRFSCGSAAIAKAMSESQAKTIIAGGDTIAVAHHMGKLSDFSYVSLAGGATLEFLAGNTLPAVEMLRE